MGLEPTTFGLTNQYSTIELQSLNCLGYKANKIKKAIIKANKAIASVNAKPKIQILNNSPCNEGFRETLIIYAPKTVPIPAPFQMDTRGA